MSLSTPGRAASWTLAALIGLGHSGAIATGPGSEPGGGVPPPEWTALPLAPDAVAKALGRIPELARALMTATGVPGLAVAVVHEDRVVFLAGYGVRTLAASEPVDEDTVFQLASVSKPLGATVVAAAVGRGAIGWDTPITCALPGFALGTPWVTESVTVADLYAHRSGLPDHAGDSLEDLGFGRQAILERLRYLPLRPFRSTYAYTNFGLTAAAESVAAASGTTWSRLSAQSIYGPLGMGSTSSDYADFVSRSNRATGHVCEGGPALTCKTTGRWVPGAGRQPDAQSPAGGVSSSVRDMAQWMRLVLGEGTFEGKPVVEREALRAALAPQMRALSPGPPPHEPPPAWRSPFYGYGMGVGVDGTGRVRLSHSGGFLLGAGTGFTLVPNLGLGIVTLTNASPVGVAEALNLTFLDLVETGTPERDWLAAMQPLLAPMYENPSVLAGQTPPDRPQPPRPLPAYSGTYSNPYYGSVRILESGSGLVMEVGPGPRRLDLTHWDGDRFAYEPEGENALGIAALDFRLDSSGQVRTMEVEGFEAGVRILWREPVSGIASAGAQGASAAAADRCAARAIP